LNASILWHDYETPPNLNAHNREFKNSGTIATHF